ncbi:MAG: 16S rRNA (adenine(1518)-N(6)/adenine(1519)-N(6))-dimethyltransferase RsmA [Acidobacteriaceae bacterium]
MKPTRAPKLGQHFLSDPAAAKKIVEALGDVSKAIVIEIGPGRGAITKLLQARAGKLIAIEYDRKLSALLKYDLLNAENFELIEADVLSVDFLALLRGKDPATPVKVVGNLPYYITSDILLKLFAASVSGVFEQLVVMVQKEVADRLAAAPGSRDYGLLSATAQMHASVRRLFVLPPAAFSPAPRVHSAVVEMRMAPRFSELGVDALGFDRFLKLLFGQKRKTILNNLKNEYDDAVSRNALEEAKVAASARAETLSLEKMAKLYRNLSPAEA